ncbi:unnamed protein product (macronuclear) [Paramecium tetraurelia]|uniref:non-specific serine/threonine protein kinase n=1 Tax=Paramecium tetraurelia TaxID=5888 RepID=A0CKQ1_PARTE|nr:uncharacterized protein GSPATT00001082001 [Paramecium tetraurelia]CAK71368.1 unnamed protein product [Paramecium tetraurelia]|eukprot:XP_001438765.1 hypothetical protein (macronuclear) [Paramecium tetraurelia strain d4-2]
MKNTQDKDIGLNVVYLIQQHNLSSDRKKVTLDQFHLLSVIGKGSIGKVVLVRKKDNQKTYALKVIKKTQLIDNHQVKQIYAERNILQNCHHPFIIKLEYAFQNETKLYFCLQYCPGGELYNLLVQKSKLTEEQAKFYASQIVLAFQYLHEQDIIYRDLKPENVLIDSEGYIKLTDFGFSKQGIQGNFGAHSKCGTAEYLAPELLVGNHGKAADWWTLGTLVYEMVVGQPAFFAETKEELFNQILHQEINYKKMGVSSQLKDLLSKLLQKDPNSRISSANEIKKHPWFKNVDWDMVLQKQVPPVFLPQLNSDDDVQYFDDCFLKEPIFSQTNSLSTDEQMNSPYQGFSYSASPPQKEEQWEF